MIQEAMTMGVGEFLVLLLVAAIIGAIGEAIGGFSPGGFFMSIVTGFVGAFIGRWIRDAFHLKDFLTVNVGGNEFPVVWSVLGGAAFVTILRLIMNRRRPRI